MNNEWMSISDMMSGLMLIFLFIAIGFMIEVESEKETMKEVAISYRDTKANLNEALYDEFENDLDIWNATIDTNNSIVFASTEVLFGVSSSEINREFQKILADFFPRYIEILGKNEYKDEVLELRVEGHTSDTWKHSTSKEEIYLKNMQLSQNRAYNVLSYCYSLNDIIIKQNRPWLQKHLRANGMAFSKLKDNDRARRVEFSVVLKSESKVYEILK
ncbi:MAG: OmpA family protein [Sulfurimonas sp.]|nr:OmpA family protein [Sulfurimonas sp.]